MKVPLATGSFMLCSSSMLIVNKLAITVYPAAGSLLLLQLLSSTIFIHAAARFGIVQIDPVSLSHLKSYTFVSLTFLAALLSNIKVLQYANVETFIVFRASTPLAISVLDYVFLGRDLPSLKSGFSLICLFIGAMSYVRADSQFEVRAYSWVVCWFVIFSFDQIYIKHVVDTAKLSPWTSSFWTNTLAIVPAFALAVGNGEYHIKLIDSKSIVAVVLSCLIGVMMSVSSFHLRGLVSATYFTVVGTVCKILSVVINYFLWDKHASHSALISLGFCICASVFYRQAPLRTTATPGSRATPVQIKWSVTIGVLVPAGIILAVISQVGLYFRQTEASMLNESSHKALVVVIGSIRGGHYAWRSFQQNLLDTLNADFAYLGPDDPTAMAPIVSYNWYFEDLQDWGSFFDKMEAPSGWRHLCSNFPSGGAQFLGGVSDCQRGSAGILLAYRELLLQRIEHHNLTEKYRWFILTRSDQLHLCAHEPLRNLDFGAINVAEGEDYGGISDRHAVYPRSLVVQGLGVTRNLLWNTHEYFNHFDKRGIHMNLEAVLKLYFKKSGLPVHRFRRTFFGVARACDRTRWSTGVSHPTGDVLGLKIKYKTELDVAEDRCGAKFLAPEENVVNDCE